MSLKHENIVKLYEIIESYKTVKICFNVKDKLDNGVWRWEFIGPVYQEQDRGEAEGEWGVQDFQSSVEGSFILWENERGSQGSETREYTVEQAPLSEDNRFWVWGDMYLIY